MTKGADVLFPKIVLFDWDNTLVDSWACLHEAMNRTLVAMGHQPWEFEEMKGRVALSLRDSFPALFGDRWTEAREVFYAAFGAIHLDYLKPLPGVVAMFDALARGGVGLGVLSNKNSTFLNQEIDHLGWRERFVGIVGATDAAADKPAQAALDLALQNSGVAAGPLVWMAGDAEVDIECANRAGCTSVLLRSEPDREGEFARFQPRLRFSTCPDFVAFVRELTVPISHV